MPWARHYSYIVRRPLPTQENNWYWRTVRETRLSTREGTCEVKVTLDLSLTTLSLSGSRDGAVVRAVASHHCGPGSIPGTRRHVWVEFAVGSLPFS